MFTASPFVSLPVRGLFTTPVEKLRDGTVNQIICTATSPAPKPGLDELRNRTGLIKMVPCGSEFADPSF